MKALSKKRKGGRPKAENVIREPNGRVSRAKEPPSKLALEARARMTGLSIERAHDQQAGQWLGRLHMAYQIWYKGERGADKQQPSQSISTGQYHALLSYQTLHNNYLKAVGAPGAVYDGGGYGLGDEDAAETWARHCKVKHKAARDAIQDAQNHSQGNLWAALDLCVIQEQQMPHMIDDLRVLANALANHFNGKRRGK
jgi:hypothetical protein